MKKENYGKMKEEILWKKKIRLEIVTNSIFPSIQNFTQGRIPFGRFFYQYRDN